MLIGGFIWDSIYVTIAVSDHWLRPALSRRQLTRYLGSSAVLLNNRLKERQDGLGQVTSHR